MAQKQAPVAPRPGAARVAHVATCPVCGLAAPLPPGAQAVRCGRCGTIVQLPGAAPPALSPLSPVPAPAAVPPVDLGRVGLGFLVGALAPVLAVIVFASGHAALDQPEPDTAAAITWYLISAALAALAGLASWLILAPSARRLLAWTLVAVIPAFWIGSVLAAAYGNGGGFIGAMFLIFAVSPLVAAYVLGMLITVIVHVARGEAERAMPPVLVSGVGIAGGLGLAAVWVLADLDRHVRLAREAHEAPAAAGLLVAGLLRALAAVHRRVR